ncbi:hypothetical protein BST61_g8208 [Cercospora zeina]
MKITSCILCSLVALSASAAPIVQKRQLEAVTGIVSPVLGTVSSATGPVFDTVTSPLSKRQLEAVTGVVNSLLNTVTSATGPVLDPVSGVLGKRQFDAVTGLVSPLVGTVTSATGPVMDTVSGVLPKRQLDAITGLVNPLVNTVSSTTGGVVDTFSGVLGKRQVEGATGAVQPALDTVLSATGPVLQAAGPVLDTASSATGPVVDTVGSTAGQLPSVAGGRIPGVNRRQESPVGGAVNTVTENWEEVTNSLGQSKTMGENDGTPLAPLSASLPEQTTSTDDSSSVSKSPEGQAAASFGTVSTDEGAIAALSEMAKQAQRRNLLAKYGAQF